MQPVAPPISPPELGTEALKLMGRISRIHRRFYKIAGPVLEQELNIQLKELLVFGAIARGHTQPSQISAVLGTPPPTTSRLLDQLTEAGYLKREPVPGDLRRCHMELTEHGQQTRTRALALLSDTLGQELARLQVPEDQLRASLEQLDLLELSLGIKEDE